MIKRLLPLRRLVAAAMLAMAGGCDSGGAACEEFEAQPDPGGRCDDASDCTPVNCPCADGSVIPTRSCVNGVCLGKALCEEACREAGGLECSGCGSATCESVRAECGSHADGCGGTLSCGSCGSGARCVGGLCTADDCEPDTCQSLGAECGELADGCGGTLSCGSCGDDLRCSSGACVSPIATGEACPDSGCFAGGSTPVVVACDLCEGRACYYRSSNESHCTRPCDGDPDCESIGEGWSCAADYCAPPM